MTEIETDKCKTPGAYRKAEAGPGCTERKMAERRAGVNTFSYTEDVLEEIEASLSRERAGTYLEATGGDRKRAIRLYTWNTAVSAAFYGPLQGLEVTLRNAMHRQLAERYGPAWYDNPGTGLDKGALERVDGVRSELRRDDREHDTARVVAALSFGFWVSLVGSGGRLETGGKANYEMTLWRPALRGAFPYRTKLTRKQAHRPLNDLRMLRNRIAHHEPIFARDLNGDHGCILDVVGWISPAVRNWIAHHSRVPVLLKVPMEAGDFHF